MPIDITESEYTSYYSPSGIYFPPINYYKKYRISIYSDSKIIYEKEIIVWNSPTISDFWKGFSKALLDNWQSVALSTIALVLTTVATGGSSTIAEVANAISFIMFLSSVSTDILNIYYAYVGYNSFNKIVDERYKEIREKYGNEIEEFIKNDEMPYIQGIRKLYTADRISDFLVNIKISDVLKVTGIIKVNEEEKGYSAGKIFVAAYQFTTFAIGFYYPLKNRIDSKGGGVYYTKEVLKGWITAPLIDAITFFYNYIKIKRLKANKVDISQLNDKNDEFAKKLNEIASKDKEVENILNNIGKYTIDLNTWAGYSESFREFLKENIKIDDNIEAKDFISKARIMEKCSEIFRDCLAITNKIFNREPNKLYSDGLSREEVSKVLNAIGEEIKKNGINDKNKIFKEGLEKLGVEKRRLSEEERPRLSISRSTLEKMIEASLGNVKINKGDYSF